jgi:hypothetical protein
MQPHKITDTDWQRQEIKLATLTYNNKNHTIIQGHWNRNSIQNAGYKYETDRNNIHKQINTTEVKCTKRIC